MGNSIPIFFIPMMEMIIPHWMSLEALDILRHSQMAAGCQKDDPIDLW